jgi:hypothetical protein
MVPLNIPFPNWLYWWLEGMSSKKYFYYVPKPALYVMGPESSNITNTHATTLVCISWLVAKLKVQ